ncbi:hypothetical protein Tco_1089571 [Tanacetum coccineum]
MWVVMLERTWMYDDDKTLGRKINDELRILVDAIRESFKEAHPTKECPLKKEDKAVEQREKFKARTTIGKENMKEPVPRDLPPTLSLGHLKETNGSPYRTREAVCMNENPEEVNKMKVKGDMDVVETLSQGCKKDYDIPPHDGMMQPLTPQTVHITPPDDDYVAPATNLILDRQLNEFGEEFSNITKVAEKVPAAWDGKLSEDHSTHLNEPLWGCYLGNLYEDSLIHCGHQVFKRIVDMAKCNRVSYERDNDLA